jgi:hypothetical protein
MVGVPRPPASAPPGGPSSMFLSIDSGAPGSSAPAPPGNPSSTFLSVDGERSRTSSSGTSHGSAIDVFSFGGGCYPTASTPQGGPPSTSSTSVVAAAGHAASTPQGARHRRLQLRWWPLPDLPPTPPRGPAINVFNFGGGLDVS